MICTEIQVELSVFKDDNTLKKVDMENLEEPEEYDKGAVSDLRQPAGICLQVQS